MAFGCAARTALCLLVLPLPVPAQSEAVAPAATGALDVHFEGLRSAKGTLRICLTRNPAFFPSKCDRDPASFKASVPARAGAQVSFNDLPTGEYALLALHDENDNARIDTMLGIPREGVGFSRNPKIMFGPPRFEAVRIHIGTGTSATTVKLQYFL
jgi:uncharacterized protein (DUF2141 family)